MLNEYDSEDGGLELGSRKKARTGHATKMWTPDGGIPPAYAGSYGYGDCGETISLRLRPYQRAIFEDHTSGVVVLHWSRQIGKSFTLAAWAVWRLMTRPGRLVTVLSNSRENGAEFLLKCAEFCRACGQLYETRDDSGRRHFNETRMELRIMVRRRVGRIKVLAANPRTARGFSGDLILDEFAFHENSKAIWEAAEPILASHPDYCCRIASTGNGRHNMFYKMAGEVSAEWGMRSAEWGNGEFRNIEKRTPD